MAIGNSCYIREIPKEQIELLELLSEMFDEKTATAIYKRLPAAYFKQREHIQKLEERINELETEIEDNKNELKSVKLYVNQFFENEKSLQKARTKLKEVVSLQNN